MKNLKLTIKGNVISKKNGQRIFHKRVFGRRKKVPFIMPSEAYLNWEEYAVVQLIKQPIWLGEYPVKLHCFFYRKTKQKFDYSNMVESVQDAIVKAGTITDDSYRHLLPVVDGMDIDKDNPRVEIIIRGQE